MNYTLLMIPDEGPVMRKRVMLARLNVKEGEYQFTMKARELYRDAMHARGLWPPALPKD